MKRERLAHRRQSERGTAVVVVVMVMTLLTAIGVFAVHAISQVDGAAGYSRIGAQAGAVAEYGTSAVITLLSNGSGATYVQDMSPRSGQAAQCRANGALNPPASGQPAPGCRQIMSAEVEANAQTTLFALSNSDEAGSFGYLSPQSAAFVTELTDARDVQIPIPGEQADENAPRKFKKVTLTTTAMVGVNPTTCNASNASSQTLKSMQADVVIPL